jgi:hypothetical protein
LADLTEDGLLPVIQSLCNGFLALLADFGSLLPFFPRNSLPLFAIKPMFCISCLIRDICRFGCEANGRIADAVHSNYAVRQRKKYISSDI